MLDPAAVLRKVVATCRARKVGLPSPLGDSEEVSLAGRWGSQSARYSVWVVEWPAREGGVCEFGGMGEGKMVEAVPVRERARRRRARRVEVNQDGGAVLVVRMRVSVSVSRL